MTALKFIYRSLRRFVEILGFNLIVTKRRNAAGYEPVLPSATYAPWLSDGPFKDTYESIRHNTLVDKYRCHELWQLVNETAKLEGALIEVGVWQGGTGALIAKSAKRIGIKDTVYLCDTFTGVVKAGENDSSYKGGEHADTSKEIVEKLVGRLKLDNVKILAGIFPETTGGSVNEDKFRFCHVDVDVYQSAKDVVVWVWPKLVVGGIIVFDDFGFQGCDGVTQFVNEERNKKDRLVIHNLNGHAILVKLSD